MKEFAILSFTLLLTACYTTQEKPLQKANIINGDAKVIAPTCPNWSSNNPSTNYGCATVTNYGVMVANPLDMLGGKQSSTFDSGSAAIAVAKARSGTASETASSEASE